MLITTQATTLHQFKSEIQAALTARMASLQNQMPAAKPRKSAELGAAYNELASFQSFLSSIKFGKPGAL